MSDIFTADEFWLSFTNVMLGIVTLICVVAFARVAFQEILDRKRAKSWVSRLLDDHTFVHGDLGITMADGGKRILNSPTQSRDNVENVTRINRNSEPDDPGNIFRSEN